jgi:CheY-like chemotaxis protein
MLRRLIREDITVTFIPGRDLRLVSVDPNQIEQVLINLAANAQDAMPRGGQLTIHTGTLLVTEEESQASAEMEPGEYVVTTVRDTGVGMDLDTQARIFEPFFTTKRPGEGTGLGLSMAYGVVRQSGGYIQVESQPGQGSTFKIYLKRADGVEAKREDAAAQLPSYGGCETVLLAEDEESVRNLMAGHLRSLGYKVLAANDGISAVEIARSHTGRIDLLISDLVMPRMGGQELAETLLKETALRKVIFVSGYAGHSTAGNNLVGTGYFLPKPFSMQEVATVVREVLDGSAQRIAMEPNRAPE